MRKNRKLALLLATFISLNTLGGCGKETKTIKVNDKVYTDYYSIDGDYFVNMDGEYQKVEDEDIAFVSKEVDENSEIKYIVVVKIGDYSFKVNAKSYDRWSEGWVSIKLLDGSELGTNEFNVVCYSPSSQIMDEIGKDIPYLEDVLGEEKLKDSDTALILVNGEIFKLRITSSNRWSSGVVELKLEDATTVFINEKNVICYNDQSKIMDQVEDMYGLKLTY